MRDAAVESTTLMKVSYDEARELLQLEFGAAERGGPRPAPPPLAFSPPAGGPRAAHQLLQRSGGAFPRIDRRRERAVNALPDVSKRGVSVRLT